ncbi:hypothetical protein LOTGIDRAFT_119936 [Lottia gigantea]|uniref:Aspartate dehydrogenase domain-containing protein n=1 Tax=Lottia gigantea TaxID=225164 RepID=V4A8L6_LOTGI|nr:hypothetical protein LOTGIDRAFT_119936 [Lottia gigantea]ESO93087.1 hypothetical protein LOTGIDRAFT_119936 [Lottia gigantea]
MTSASKIRVGVVGYGNMGHYLTKAIEDNDNLELAFVWNRSTEALEGNVKSDCILKDLNDFAIFSPDLIVEVAHPCITREYGAKFLQYADYMIGSPTALADKDLEVTLRKAARVHGLYVPSGAFWGGEDIKKMADRGTLQALKVTISKHPYSFKLEGDLKEKNSRVTGDTAVELYSGPVRELCPLAPNNVNTMAVAALAAHNLGFDGVQCRLVSDPKLTDWHIVEVETWGPGDISKDKAFHCHTVRRNPAQIGNVTGSATYVSFLSSMVRAHGKGPGVHLC